MNVRNLLLRNSQSPGDVMMLTAAVRDLHAQHPGTFRTAVATATGASQLRRRLCVSIR